MRVIALIAVLVAQGTLAAECLHADSHATIVLSGVIEYKPDPPPSKAFGIIFNLAEPICVEGTKYDGTHFKRDGLKSIQLGIPADLNKGLRQGQRAALRGELWGPCRQ